MKNFPGQYFKRRHALFVLAAVGLGLVMFLLKQNAPPALAVVAPVRPMVAAPPLQNASPVPNVTTGRQMQVESLDVEAGTPRFLPGTEDGNPITRMPWVSPHVFIKLAQIGFGPNMTVLSETDVITGVQTPLRAINAVILKNWGIDSKGGLTKLPGGPIPSVSLNPYGLRLSPQGRRLLWESQDGDRPVWTAMTLDGLQRVDWPRQSHDGCGMVGWMRDDIHFVEITRTGRTMQAYVYGLDAPGQVRVFPLMRPDAMFPFVDSNSEIDFTTDGHGWIMDIASKRYEIIPGPHVWTLRSTPLLEALDPSITTRKPTDSALSPDGSRLVFRVGPDGASYRDRLYISRPDGSEARMIFESSATRDFGVGYSPKWTPDGQGIVLHIDNVSHEDGLYLLPLYPSAAPSDDAPQMITLSPFPLAPRRLNGRPR